MTEGTPVPIYTIEDVSIEVAEHSTADDMPGAMLLRVRFVDAGSRCLRMCFVGEALRGLRRTRSSAAGGCRETRR